MAKLKSWAVCQIEDLRLTVERLEKEKEDAERVAFQRAESMLAAENDEEFRRLEEEKRVSVEEIKRLRVLLECAKVWITQQDDAS